jgi:type VI secretion system secreted protein VgrG
MSVIELTTESGLAFDVRDFGVSEGLNQPFVIQATAIHGDPDIDFGQIVGQPARFALNSGRAHATDATRCWTGIVSQLELARSENAARGTTTWVVTLSPKLWLMSQRSNYRIFQFKSEVDIAIELLEAWKVDHRVLLDRAEYRSRKYKVQYGESDYVFFARLLEEVGVTWFFEEGPDGSRIVLTDWPQGAEPRQPVGFEDAPQEAAQLDFVTRLQLHGRVRPTKYTLQDHDYRRPADFDLSATAIADDATEPELERYRYAPGSFLFAAEEGEDTPAADDRGKTRTDAAMGKRLAQRRLDAKRSGGSRISFETNCLDLAPGTVFSILGHPRERINAPSRHLVVASRHYGTATGEWQSAADAASADKPYFPPITIRKPRVVGVECATVVGADGEEVHTEEFGRVRVQFHWDRYGKRDEQSSCWIHVSQPWSGAGMGSIHLPRIGQEVLVEFLGGDPDRPIVTGRVYTNLQKVPYALPAAKTVTVIARTRTFGGDGYNEILADDKKGAELLSMQAERDLHTLVKNDERRRINRDLTEAVKNNRVSSVGNKWTFSALPPRGTSPEVAAKPSGFSWNHAELKIAIGDSLLHVTHGTITIKTGGSTITLEKDKITFDSPTVETKASQLAKTDGKLVDIHAETDVVVTSGGVIKLNC